MEEDYGNQINGLKDQIREKIEIINKLMEDQETVTTVPAPSSRVFRKEFQIVIVLFFNELLLGCFIDFYMEYHSSSLVMDSFSIL